MLNPKNQQDANMYFLEMWLLWKPLDNNTYLIEWAHKPLLPSLWYCYSQITSTLRCGSCETASTHARSIINLSYGTTVGNWDTKHQTWFLRFQTFFLGFYSFLVVNFVIGRWNFMRDNGRNALCRRKRKWSYLDCSGKLPSWACWRFHKIVFPVFCTRPTVGSWNT